MRPHCNAVDMLCSIAGALVLRAEEVDVSRTAAGFATKFSRKRFASSKARRRRTRYCRIKFGATDGRKVRAFVQ